MRRLPSIKRHRASSDRRCEATKALLSGRNFETKQFEETIAEESFGKLKKGILAFIYSGPHVQDSFPPSLSWPAFFNRSGVALPQV